MSKITAIACAIALGGCQSYAGISKVGQAVYLTGSTSYLLFSVPWVRRCHETPAGLFCYRLNVADAPSDVPEPVPAAR